mmetsp:Transcript_95936/g.222387  ORF Transcript_95936/g.222387 Transcript_95936/m.222387 type:complete len:294 (-) Transcript_95936:103-984(-)
MSRLQAALSLLLAVSSCATAHDDEASLLQVSLRTPVRPHPMGNQRDLAMAYVPYNFGHTVAEVAMRHDVRWGDCGMRGADSPAECLGHSSSEVTGCHLMNTPGKYWPKELAASYFGNRTVFGILRDPYERLVAQFRGSGWGLCPESRAACDVSGGVKKILMDYIEASNPFAGDCMLLPQAEYFDQPFGATIFVDNRLFPESANELLAAHGCSDLQIRHKDIAHVSGCDDKWAADLDAEARALVRQVYKRDFELLCKHLGYCDIEESVCLTHVQGMCPEQLFKWDPEALVYKRT